MKSETHMQNCTLRFEMILYVVLMFQMHASDGAPITAASLANNCQLSLSVISFGCDLWHPVVGDIASL